MSAQRWLAPRDELIEAPDAVVLQPGLRRVLDVVMPVLDIPEDVQVVLAADYDTALAERDRARDIAARLGLMVAEVDRIVATLGHTDRVPSSNPQRGTCWCGLDDLRAAIDGYSDDDSAPDPQHPAYKALHRDAEVEG